MSDDDKLSIAVIRDVIAKRGECAGPMTTFPEDGVAHVTTVCGENWVEYIQWLTAMVEKTPILVEIVDAALAYQKAKKVAAKTRHALMRAAFPDALSAESDAMDKEEIRCRDAYLVALAMVRE